MHPYTLADSAAVPSPALLFYPALIRLENQGWIKTEWGVSETKRKVKFYELTKAGLKQLKLEIANWESTAALVARFLEAKASEIPQLH